MKALVNLRDVPVIERKHARAGTLMTQSLLYGKDYTPENFYLQLSSTSADFASPRHRHNFDQVRVQLVGDADFARDGVMKPGMIGYFPEGTFYGPQSMSGASTTLVFQFGGASASGYISEQRFQAGIEEMKQFGRFESGIFRRNEAQEGRKNQDAYEAVWEHVNKKRLRYQDSDLSEPVFMDPEAFEWCDEPGMPGARRKHLGVFTSRGTRLSILGASACARVPIAAHCVVFVLRGRGRSGAGEFEVHSTLQTGDSGQCVDIDAGSELLEIHIPPLAREQSPIAAGSA